MPRHEAAPAGPSARVLTRALRAAPPLSRSARPRLRAGPGGVELHAGPSRTPPTVDPLGRGRTITGGAALRNVELAMAHLGHRPHTLLLPDPTDPLHLATIAGGDGAAVPEPPERRLYLAMTLRRGDGAFSARQLPAPLVDRLHAAAAMPTTPHPAADTGAGGPALNGAPSGVTVTAIAGGRLRTIGTVLAAAARARHADEHDLSDVENLLAQHPTATAAPGTVLTDRLSRGQLLLIATPTDTPADWVHAGWAAQNVLLTAADSGLLGGVVGGVLDAPGVRATLADRLRLGNCPQLLVRVGWARVTRPGDRHPGRDRPVEAGGLPLT